MYIYIYVLYIYIYIYNTYIYIYLSIYLSLSLYIYIYIYLYIYLFISDLIYLGSASVLKGWFCSSDALQTLSSPLKMFFRALQTLLRRSLPLLRRR